MSKPQQMQPLKQGHTITFVFVTVHLQGDGVSRRGGKREEEGAGGCRIFLRGGRGTCTRASRR